MKNASFFTTKNVVSGIDTGGTQRYTIDINPPSEPVIWRSMLVIAWFSCEGNLHHLMTETLHPIANALENVNTNDSENLPLVAVGASYGVTSWNAGESGCHGATFYPLFNVINVDPVIFSFGGSRRQSTPRENVYPAPNERWDMNNIYCFRETRQVSDSAHSASLSQKLLSWAGCNPSTGQEFRVVIVQRQRSRRILNLDQLVFMANNTVGVTNVSVLALEKMTMREQVREMACGNVIVAGVQGAGLQWTTLWGNNNGNRAALIEWGWRDWGSYYTGRISGKARSIFRRIPDENIHETCLVQRTGSCCCPGVNNTSCIQDGLTCPWPTKNVDVTVDLTSWSQDLTEMIAFVGQ